MGKLIKHNRSIKAISNPLAQFRSCPNINEQSKFGKLTLLVKPGLC